MQIFLGTYLENSLKNLSTIGNNKTIVRKIKEVKIQGSVKNSVI